MAKRIDPERAKELIEMGGFAYIDVRTPDEFNKGHVPGARNVPYLVRGPQGAGMYKNQHFLDYIQGRFDREAKMIIGCQKGGRSMRAADLLSENGFSNVFDMRGGFVGETDPFGRITFPGWCSKGYPTSSESKPEERYKVPKARA